MGSYSDGELFILIEGYSILMYLLVSFSLIPQKQVHIRLLTGYFRYKIRLVPLKVLLSCTHKGFCYVSGLFR